MRTFKLTPFLRAWLCVNYYAQRYASTELPNPGVLTLGEFNDIWHATESPPTWETSESLRVDAFAASVDEVTDPHVAAPVTPQSAPIRNDGEQLSDEMSAAVFEGFKRAAIDLLLRSQSLLNPPAWACSPGTADKISALSLEVNNFCLRHALGSTPVNRPALSPAPPFWHPDACDREAAEAWAVKQAEQAQAHAVASDGLFAAFDKMRQNAVIRHGVDTTVEIQLTAWSAFCKAAEDARQKWKPDPIKAVAAEAFDLLCHAVPYVDPSTRLNKYGADRAELFRQMVALVKAQLP